MATRLPTATRNAKVAAATGLLDAGSGAGKIRIYTGTQPADPNSAASGTLLVEINLADPAYGSPSNGSAALASTPRSGVAVATGTAGWFRALDSDNNSVFDGNISDSAGSGVELVLDNLSIAEDQQVSISNLAYTQPASLS